MGSDWRGIHEFVQVVESGSFTRAAQSLHLSKSYISRTISSLEDRLGVQLLFRNTRRLSLTAAGEKFYQRCAQMRGIFSEAERELGGKFDIKGFHDTVLGGGALPLTLLERRVDQWIAKEKAKQA